MSHDGRLRKQDFFGGSLWVETNQDAAFSFTKYRQLFDTTTCRLQDGFAIAEHGLGTQKVVQVGHGKAVYLNLSPQRYLQYREEGTDTDAHRATFLRQINPSGRPPRVVVRHQGRRPPQCEATYWSKGGPHLRLHPQERPRKRNHHRRRRSGRLELPGNDSRSRAAGGSKGR